MDSYSKIFTEVLKAANRKKFWLVLVGLLIVSGNFLTATALQAMNALLRGTSVIEAIGKFDIIKFAPIAVVPIIFFSLIYEARLLGWEKSSFIKIIEAKTHSIRTDIFYFILYCSNLFALMGIIFSLGISFWIQFEIRETFSFGWVSESIIGGFLIQCLIGPFIFYWIHRMDHSRFFWEFHKLHHASKEMCLINNFRNHPVLHALRMTIETLPGALLGVHPVALLSYAFLNGFVVVWQHTNLNWNMPFIEKYIFIASREHRVHHSELPEHYDKNLGYFVFWDWLFGTLHYPRILPSEPPIGVSDPLYNHENPAKGLVQIYFHAFRAFFRELWATFRILPRNESGRSQKPQPINNPSH